jgi:plastocyanin
MAPAALMLAFAACSNRPPMAPTPPDDIPTANAYILPGAINFGANAFGDEPVVIFKGERMRWQNLDAVEHDVVADAPTLPEFDTTGRLSPGAEQSFVMQTVGTTKIHCSIHPEMTGTLIVKER